MNAALPQRLPQPGDGRILDYVIQDFQDRAEKGRAKYGTYLQAHNGRNALVDGYQEASDLVMYLRQQIVEREEETEMLKQVLALVGPRMSDHAIIQCRSLLRLILERRTESDSGVQDLRQDV